MSMLPSLLCTLVVGIGAGLRQADANSTEPISMQRLIEEMISLPALAEFPDPPFTCKQFSSYDRRSTDPDVKTTENWFANHDAGEFLRVDEVDGRKEHVMVDVDGPGCLVRFWSANPKGVLRVYLDDSAEPVIEARADELLGGRVAGIPEPLACERSKGWNLYLPIPYAKHCKVTCDEGGFYYHVDYRTYPSGTKVETFTLEQLGAARDAIQALARRLAAPRNGGGPPADRDKKPFAMTIEPDQSAVIPASQLDGPRAICGFLVNVDAYDVTQALRHVIVEMTFDGETTVVAPIGDFFGSAPGVNPYASLPSGVAENGDMWCHWYMPFKKSCEFKLTNMGTEKVTVRGGVSSVPYPWTDRTMYFHAKWRSDLDVPTRPMQDWNYLATDGKGVFVGVAFNIANPVKDWWGEGDEKIYVDGETFPSTFGTGTEDYYGYAWCYNVPFTHAYHNQTRVDGPGNYGHTSVNRWHVLDRIPFTTSFRFDMELWHWHPTCNVDMAVTAYWYALAGGSDGFTPMEKDDLRLRILPPYTAPRVQGAIEAEELPIYKKSGEPRVQELSLCSNEKQLWWTGAHFGDQLTLLFPANAGGPYMVRARFIKAPDYATVQCYINGHAAGAPIDLYSKSVALSDVRDLGTFDLKTGENKLTLEIVGKNEKAVGKFGVGLDYLLLERIPQ